LDGQLTPSEQKQVEEHLESDSAYNDALKKLHQTSLILRSLPQRPAPRNFTLSAEMNKKKVNLPSFFQIFRFSSAVAVLGLVMLLVFDFLPSLTQLILNQKDEVAQPPSITTVPAAVSNEPPMIIIWETAPPEVLGKGGGGGGGNGQAGVIPSYAIPQPDAEPSALRSEKGIPPAQPLSPQAPTLESPPEATLVAPQITESEPAISGTGPILGIPPSNERGWILSTLSIQPPTPSNEKVSYLRISEFVLGVLALLTGIIAFLVHKKQNL
jgi:hypothetical protein